MMDVVTGAEGLAGGGKTAHDNARSVQFAAKRPAELARTPHNSCSSRTHPTPTHRQPTRSLSTQGQPCSAAGAWGLTVDGRQGGCPATAVPHQRQEAPPLAAGQRP